MPAPIMPTSPIESPAAWIGSDMAKHPERWLVTLSPEDINDLEQAARHYLSLNKDVGEISANEFPLLKFHHHLAKLKHKLIHGNGVEVLRGLPIEHYSQKFAATVFCGIGAHLGQARSQNADGHILGHVRDTGANASDTNTRIYQTAARQTFHTDSADVVGLLCINDAKHGGESLLVSAISVFNKMLAERADLLPYLFDNLATDRRGEVPDGEQPYLEIPPLSWYQGLLTVFYQRQYIDSAQRFDGALKLTEKHVEALDYFDRLTNDENLNFGMQLQPGDMQFVYNHSQLHDRTGFEDWPEPNKRRHLLRLWLSLPGDRALPPCFAQRYGSIEVGNRGGINTTHTKLHAPID